MNLSLNNTYLTRGYENSLISYHYRSSLCTCVQPQTIPLVLIEQYSVFFPVVSLPHGTREASQDIRWLLLEWNCVLIMGYVSPDAASVLSHLNSSMKSSPSFHSWNKNHSYQAFEWVVNFMENLRRRCWPHRPLPTGCQLAASSLHTQIPLPILTLPLRWLWEPNSSSALKSHSAPPKLLIQDVHTEAHQEYSLCWNPLVIFLMYTCIVKKKSFKEHTDKKL